MDKISYSLGIILANNLKGQGISELDAASAAEGMKDVFAGNPLQVGEEEANQLVQGLLHSAQEARHKAAIEAGDRFLAENAKREEVVTLESGLQYEVIRKGEGKSPSPSDKVTVHYQGQLLDGTVFDSSLKRGQPATFGVTQVIQGWVEALQRMKVGAKWRLFVPWKLAYGSRGAGDTIGPYSTLIFDVELLGIN